MKTLSKVLTNYIIRKGMVDETDREIYEYGFQIAMELGIFVFFCVLLSVITGMIKEGILFFIIFAPLRSYAGGLHLEKYASCLVLSCLTFGGILLVVKCIEVPAALSLILLFVLELAVYLLYPVENVNRLVDKEENVYFKKKLRIFLIADMMIAIVCLAVGSGSMLFLITATFLMITVTMSIGKYKYNKAVTLDEVDLSPMQKL